MASSLRRRLIVLAFLAALASLAGLLVLSGSPRQEPDRFTEFSVLASDDRPRDFWETMVAGQPTVYTMRVSNREDGTVTYRVEARLAREPSGLRLRTDGTGAEPLDGRSFIIRDLPAGATWEHHVEVVPLEPRDRQLLEFALFSPLPRDGHHLQTFFLGCGTANVTVYESAGKAVVTLNGGDTSFHECRIEAWQNGTKAAEMSMRIEVDEEQTWTFRFPAGETRFRLYDGALLALDDTGAEAVQQLWVDIIQ